MRCGQQNKTAGNFRKSQTRVNRTHTRTFFEYKRGTATHNIFRLPPRSVVAHTKHLHRRAHTRKYAHFSSAPRMIVSSDKAQLAEVRRQLESASRPPPTTPSSGVGFPIGEDGEERGRGFVAPVSSSSASSSSSSSRPRDVQVG